MLSPSTMRRITLLGSLAVGVSTALLGCSGSTTDGPSGFTGSSRAGSSGAGSAGVGGSGVGGSGVGGSGGEGGDASSNAGAAGSGGSCDPATMPGGDCILCVCQVGMWVCTEHECLDTVCGARAGNTCSATEYCAYTAGQHCGAADASSTCQPQPGACDDIYMPVCGCDHKTYASSCDAALHGQGVDTDGVCDAAPAE
jgi:Kazal-type serine protease inhibitor domain